MNIKHFLSAAATLTLLAACSEYDPGESGNVVDLTDAEIKTIQEYTENFVERYGEMDPNHTWGFGELAGTEEIGTRASDPKSNMWIDYTVGKVQMKDDNGNLYWKDETNNNQPTKVQYRPDGQPRQPYYLYNGNDVVIDFTVKGDIAIPGFPVKNYYLSDDYNQEADSDPTKPARNVRGVTTVNPADREDYYHCRFPNENQDYWFSSKDELLSYMREHGIREVIPVGDVAQCNTLTDAEVADVYDKFSEEWHETNPDINLTSYFVQQVWRGDAQYPYWEQNDRNLAANNGQNYWETTPSGYVIGGEHMDYLTAKGEGYTPTDQEHFYNFNLANYSNGQGGMMLIYDSNTQNFSYYNSYQSGDNCTIWNHYRLLELHGNWYVGFDFESVGEYEKDVKRDYKYNDWIVKIIPGHGTITPPDPNRRTVTHARRVMCEDLGSTYDFDYNDLVFDVKYTREEKYENGVWTPVETDAKWMTTITLRASGGTLPIYIENFDGTKYDVHATMGGTKGENDQYQPINVGTGLVKNPVTLPSYRVTSTNPENIRIFVYSKDAERSATKELELPNPSGLQNFGENLAPMKICVPTYVRWTKEYQQIEWAYPKFAEWVQNESGTAGFGHENDWTLDSVDKYLYNP